MKANPAGILMIGLGVVLLNLAYTGRGVAVWKAITGTSGSGATGNATPPVIEPEMAGAVPDDTALWGVVPSGAGIAWRA